MVLDGSGSERKVNVSEMKKALYWALGGLVGGTFLFLGPTYPPSHSINEEAHDTRWSSPLSYVELVTSQGVIKEVSQRNRLTNKVILGFELTPEGLVKKTTQNNDFLITNEKPLISSPGDGSNINWNAVNQTAQRYIAYFERK